MFCALSIVPRGTFIDYLFNSLSNPFFVYFRVYVPRGTFFRILFDLFPSSIFSRLKSPSFALLFSHEIFPGNDISDGLYCYWTNNLNNLAIWCSLIFSYISFKLIPTFENRICFLLIVSVGPLLYLSLFLWIIQDNPIFSSYAHSPSTACV